MPKTAAPLSTLEVFQSRETAPAKLQDLEHAVVSMVEFSCINASGDEAISFLQGQFTNHILDMQNGDCQITGYCNPKGRALAVLWLLKKEDGCYLLVPEDIADGLLKRLQMFKMRAKVTLEIETHSRFFAVIGSSEKRNLIAGSHQQWRADDRRSFVSVDIDQAEQWLNELDIPFLQHDYWNLGQILAAEPMVYASTMEALIPQHMNLDLVNGVSFTKGCYPGQEIVARLRYLGKLKQRMIIGICDNTNQIAPGTAVFTEEKGEQKAGTVIDAVNVGGFQYLSVNIAAVFIDSGDIHIGSQQGPILSRLPLPYTITLEKNG